MANRLVSVDESYRFPTPLEARLTSTFASLAGGKVPVSQLPTDALVTDANVAATVNGSQTGAAIDQRIATQVTPIVEQITADYVASDQAVIDAAAAAVSASPKIVEIEARELPDRGNATVALFTSADSMTTKGSYKLRLGGDASGLGFPSANAGRVDVFDNNGIITQKQTVLEADWQEYYRRRNNGVWTAWEAPFKKIAASIPTQVNAATTPLAGRLDSIEKTDKAYVALSRSGGTAYSVSGAVSATQRQPFRVTHPATSFAVRFSNIEERTGTVYPGTVTINGVWMGEAEADAAGKLTGQFKTVPVQVSGPVTLVDGKGATGLIFNSTLTIKPNVEYIVSYGITADGPTTHRSQGASWATGSPLNADDPTVAITLNPSTFSTLSTVVEVNSRAPRIAWVGDSHVAGGAADYPIYESLPHMFAMSNGFVPINAGLGGSTFLEWSNANDVKWTKFTQNGVKADHWILSLGQNDIYGSSVDLATLKTRFATVATIGRNVFGPNMYVTTVMPRNIAGQEAFNAIRRDFNDWLRTLPMRALGCFDIAAAVTDASGDVLQAAYVVADNTHLNTAGNARAAQAVRITK